MSENKSRNVTSVLLHPNSDISAVHDKIKCYVCEELELWPCLIYNMQMYLCKILLNSDKMNEKRN